MSLVPKLLVIGGNGFVGSHVCKAAVAKGWEVSSMSRSGTPFRTPSGHSPGWVSRVEWHAADALNASQHKDLFHGKTAIVHTTGTLLPSPKYKEHLQKGELFALAGALFSQVYGENPLNPHNEYDTLNRDAALRVMEAFAGETSPQRTFVFVSATGVFSPPIPARYVESKREAERGLAEIGATSDIRTVFLRPGLIYHAHQRPLVSPAAVLLSASANFHDFMSKQSLPTPAGLLRSLSLNSLSDSLTTHPLHVEHVAKAAITAVEESTISGPVEVPQMRAIAGWTEDGQRNHAHVH